MAGTMGTGKTFRHGQILRLVSGERIGNQEELRRRLAAQKMRPWPSFCSTFAPQKTSWC